MIKAILFDLDGTLIKTDDIIIEVFKELFKNELPHIDLSNKEYNDFLGYTLFESLGMYATSEKSVDYLVKQYRILSEAKINLGIKAYNNANEILKYLNKKNIKFGIVTSKMGEVAKRHLIKAGLDYNYDCFVGYEDVSTHKPSGEPILKAIELLNLKNEEVVYIGDHENDIVAAKKANCLSCAVTYSKRLKEMLSFNPDFVIDDLINIKDLI